MLKRILFALLLMLVFFAIPVWASDLSDLALGMTAGTWEKLTISSGPPSDANNLNSTDGLLPYSSNMLWDSNHHLGYFFGGVHGNDIGTPHCYAPNYNEPLCAEEAIRMIKYDEATNTWAYQKDLVRDKFSALREEGHANAETTLDPATGDVYRRSYVSHVVSRFDFLSKTWDENTASPLSLGGGYGDTDIGSFTWFPEANGIIKPDGYNPGYPLLYWSKVSNTWSIIGTSVAGGGIQVAIYNPVQHNMLIGGGHTAYGDCTKFYILSYSAGTWTISTVHTIPAITGWTISGPGQICFDADSQSGGNIAVDPVTGHYIVLSSAPDGSATWTYDVNIPDPETPANDTWTLLTGANEWPDTFYLGYTVGFSAGYIGSVPIPEYGVIMYFVETNNMGHPIETWLYKFNDRLSFSTKCALPGVLKCDAFDSASDLRYSWGTIDHGDSQAQFGHICDDALSGSHTNYPFDFTYMGTFANTTATIGPDSTCKYPTIDTSIKVSGAGSIKFNIVGNSFQAVPGDFSEPFKKYMDGTFGYIGPYTAMPSNGAHHEGDDLWLQYYLRNDSNFISTNFTQRAFEAFTFTTLSAGATRLYINTTDCNYGGPAYPYAIHDTYQHNWPNYPSLTPPSDQVNTVGRTIRFVWGQDFLTDQNFTIVSLPADGPTSDTHCSIVVNTSPTPSAAGGGIPMGGTIPLNGYGLISGSLQTDGQKGVGVFGDSATASHTDPAAQVAVNFRQLGMPGVYYYMSGGGIGALVAQPMIGCPDIYPEIFEKSLTDMTEPPCIRYHADQWQEHTIHVKLIAPGPHNVFESWIDGIMVQRTQVYDVSFQEGFASNGMGGFFLSPYNTAKDPNQSHADAAVWYDDLIISTQPIPMGANGTGTIPGCVTPDHLSILTQPLSMPIGTTFTVSAAIVDSANRTCSASSDTVTISKHSGECTGMTLNGTDSSMAVAGVFTTTDLSLTGATGNCILDVSASGLTGASTDSFVINSPVVAGGTNGGPFRMRILR